MKKIFLVLLFILCCSFSYAQTSYFRSKGYKGDITLGINGDLSCGGTGIALMTSHGYQLNRYLYIGGGVGYENEMLPLFGHIKSYFIKNDTRVIPWAEFKMGFDACNSGVYLSPGAGFSLQICDKFGISCCLAYGLNVYWDEHNVGMRLDFHF